MFDLRATITLRHFHRSDDAYLVFENLAYQSVAELQPITHVWYLDLWATKLSRTFTDDAYLVIEISGHAHVHRRKDLDLFHQHLLLHQCSSAMKYGYNESKGATILSSYIRCQLGSNLESYRQPLGSQGAGRVPLWPSNSELHALAYSCHLCTS